ncbi:MAG: type I-U CRISPR-associated protein Cas8c [Myxococcales bacterium]|nr:type I-U CRISPR-associated protein Cas8c [Myxococcales bacterium]
MARSVVPVDLFNPGQVFACLGLMELAEQLIGPTMGGFVWQAHDESEFVLECEAEDDPLATVLRFLAEAEVRSLVPPNADLTTEKWSVSSLGLGRFDAFPVPQPESPASLPAVLSARGVEVIVASWGDARVRDRISTGRDALKFWGGSGGYPGAALLRDALDLARDQLEDASERPFDVARPQSSSFRFDWRRDYVPLDAGFSLNEHASMAPQGYPVVEILAAIGLSHARPERQSKLRYRYGVVGHAAPLGQAHLGLLPAAILRAGLGGSPLPFDRRAFIMQLDWPGQENQARCITSVFEETIQ